MDDKIYARNSYYQAYSDCLPLPSTRTCICYMHYIISSRNIWYTPQQNQRDIYTPCLLVADNPRLSLNSHVFFPIIAQFTYIFRHIFHAWSLIFHFHCFSAMCLYYRSSWFLFRWAFSPFSLIVCSHSRMDLQLSLNFYYRSYFRYMLWWWCLFGLSISFYELRYGPAIFMKRWVLEDGNEFDL